MSSTLHYAYTEIPRDRSATCSLCGHQCEIVDRIFGQGQTQRYNSLFTTSTDVARAEGSSSSKASRDASKAASQEPLALQRCPACGLYDSDGVRIVLETYLAERRLRSNKTTVLFFFFLLTLITVIGPIIILYLIRALMRGFSRRRLTEDDVNDAERVSKWLSEWQRESPALLSTLRHEKDNILGKQDAYKKLEALRRRYDFPDQIWGTPTIRLPSDMKQKKGASKRQTKEPVGCFLIFSGITGSVLGALANLGLGVNPDSGIAVPGPILGLALGVIAGNAIIKRKQRG